MAIHELKEEKRQASRSTYGDGWEYYDKTWEVCSCGEFEQEYPGWGKSISPLFLLHLINEIAKSINVTDDTERFA